MKTLTNKQVEAFNNVTYKWQTAKEIGFQTSTLNALTAQGIIVSKLNNKNQQVYKVEKR